MKIGEGNGYNRVGEGSCLTLLTKYISR